MVIFAIFAAGFFIGAIRGVFSLAILEMAVGVVAFVGNWRAGFVAACAHSLEMGMVLVAGFLVALIASVLSPKFERESGHWLRRHRSDGRSLVRRL